MTGQEREALELDVVIALEDKFGHLQVPTYAWEAAVTRSIDAYAEALAAREEPREHVAERIGRLAEMSTEELIAINITSPDFNLATDELSQRQKGKVRLTAREDTDRPERKILDLGGPDRGRYWRVVSDHAVDDPDVRSAAIYARVTGSVGCTYNGAEVEWVVRDTERPDHVTTELDDRGRPTRMVVAVRDTEEQPEPVNGNDCTCHDIYPGRCPVHQR